MHALDTLDKAFTIESTKGAKINLYYYKKTSGSSKREKPILLVHGFNSSGAIWRNEQNNYIKELASNGYDVIVLDMRGNAVDTDGDYKIDAPDVGTSWGYGVRDLGDDVGIALARGIDYLNQNLPGRNYKKADVITHSTGALAVTSYSHSLGLVSYAKNIDVLIELAPPNNGSTNLIANIKKTAHIIPSVFAQSMIAYEYGLEFLGNKVWIPGGRMESETLRRELMAESLFLKSIKGLGPNTDIKTFIAIGNDDWVVGDWSPVVEKRTDIGYEYFIGLDHFNFCNSPLVIKALIDKLNKGKQSIFFNRYKPYRNKGLIAFSSGPGIDHPDDTFDTVTFVKDIKVDPRKLFNMYLRIAARKNKTYLLKYWEGVLLFEKAQKEIDCGKQEKKIFDNWCDLLEEKNTLFHDCHIYASVEYLECPDIAILANGYYGELAKLVIEKVEEPVRIIDHTFNPSIVNEQKVLLIPTGGLSGLSCSEIFRKKISEYVKNGGTVVCFSQQYGYDFNALPTGSFKGYGWQEDASCHSKAAYIEDFHQVLASQSKAYPNVKLDGYFTDYPDGASVLLRRTKNLMPAMLMYNYGKGLVIAACLYSDWGYLNGQVSLCEINLIRDLIRWSKGTARLPEYKTGEDLTQTIPVHRDFDKIEFILKSPEGTILERKISDNPLYELTTLLTEPGIYCVDFILYDSKFEIIQPQAEGFYFCFSRPPEGTIENPNFNFDITTDCESYILGAEAVFTFHIGNNTSEDEFIKCKAVLPHHRTEFTESIEVPSNSIVSFEKNIKVTSTDLLAANFYSSGNNFLGRRKRGISVFEPHLSLKITTGKKQYTRGQNVSIKINISNNSKMLLEPLLVLNIINPENEEICYIARTLELGKGKTEYWEQDFKIAEDAEKGIYKIKLNAFSNHRLIGSSAAYFDIPNPLLYIDYDMPGALEPGSENSITFYIRNPLHMDSLPGTLLLKFLSPQNTITWQDKRDFKSIPALSEERFIFIPEVPDSFGLGNSKFMYSFIYADKETCETIKLPSVSSALLKIEMDRRFYMKNEPILTKVNIDNGNEQMNSGILNLRVLQDMEAGHLYGTIRNDKNEVIKGAVVNGIYTNSEGRYKLVDLEEGMNLLDVSFPGSDRLLKNVDILAGNNNLDIPLISTKYGDLFGRFEDSVGSDLILTPVNVAGSDASIRRAVVSTEDRFEFKDLPVGEYLLDIWPEGISKKIQIIEGDNIITDKIEQDSKQADVIVSDSGSIAQYSLIQEIEPNDDFVTATEINPDIIIHGRIYDLGDEDYYKLSVNAPSVLNILLENVPVGLNPYIKIYNSEQKWLASTASLSGQEIRYSLEISEPGIYYLSLKDRYNIFSSFEEYSLKIDLESGLDGYEPNHDIESAKKIDIRREIVATIFPKSDVDYFVFDIQEKGILYIETQNIPDTFRASLKIYNAGGGLITQKTGSPGENIAIETEIQQLGQYYLLIKDRYSSFSSLEEYCFKSYFIKTIDAFEPNDTKEKAVAVDFGKNYFATISTKGDVDYYKLSVPDSGKLIVYIKNVPSNIRPHIRIYRDYPEAWISSMTGLAGEDLVMEFETEEPSNYYIQIQDRYNSESSFVRYKLLAVYIPYDEYLPEDFLCFERDISISNLGQPKEIDIEIPGIGGKGNYYIQGILTSPSLQRIAQAIEPFYVVEGGVQPGRLMEDVDMVLTFRENQEDIAPLEVFLKNRGYGDFFGELQVKSDFFKDSTSLFLESGKESIKVFDVDIKGLPVGVHQLTVSLQDEGRIIESLAEKLEIGFPELSVSYLEDTDFTFVAGKKAVFNFEVINRDSSGGVCDLDFKCGDLFDRSISCFLEPGTRQQLSFEFLLPEDMEEGFYEAEYMFKGRKNIIKFEVLGVKIDIACGMVGDVFKIRIKNRGFLKNIALFAEVRCGLHEKGRDFILEDENELIFNIYDTGDQKKIYYGIYFISGKALYLDSFLLKDEEERPDVSLKVNKAKCDKGNYINGETIYLDWELALESPLSVRLVAELANPDYSSSKVIEEDIELQKGGAFINKAISPDLTMTGLYRIIYRFIYKGTIIAQGSIFFDAGEDVEVETRLIKRKYIKNENITLTVCCFSTFELNGVLTVFLNEKTAASKIISFEGYKEFDFIIKSNEVGRHQIYSSLFYGNQRVDSERRTFDILEEAVMNHSPVLLTIGEKEIAAGNTLEFFVEAIDIDEDLLVYSIKDLPVGAVFDLDAARFFWNPDNDQVGEHFITFSVSDGKETVSEIVKVEVVRPMDEPPEIKGIAEPSAGVAPLEVHFSADSVTSRKGIVKYEWDFDGKGVYDSSAMGCGDAVFVYTSEGSFTPTLRLTDNRGLISVHTAVVNAYRNPEAPQVFLDPVLVEGVAPCKVNFRGFSFCRDDICKYEWDFDGDGVFDACSTKSGNVVKTYSLPGTFNAEFRVTSSKGLSSSKCATVGVSDPFVLDAETMFLTDKENVPVEVRFNAHVNSRDEVRKYQWDFQGDGIFDFSSMDSATTSHVYYQPGVYTPTLRVTDENNVSLETEKNVHFGISYVDNLKSERMVLSVRKGETPFKIDLTFNTDFDIPNADYFWDFDGDGSCDLITDSAETVFTYYNPGIYIAKAKAVDADGFAASYSEIVYVTGTSENNDVIDISNTSTIKKRANVFKNKTGNIQLSDKTSVTLPAAILDRDDVINIEKLTEEQVYKEVTLEEQGVIPAGEYREYNLEEHKDSFDKDIIISIPYVDKDKDGIVDEKNIDELTLNIYCFDEVEGEWKILSDALVFPDENFITAKTNHFSLFAVAGTEVKDLSVQESVAENKDKEERIDCFIVTAVFDAPSAQEVKIFRKFRDRYLLRTKAGRGLVNFYYSFSPPAAEFIKRRPILKVFLKAHLKFLVSLVRFVL